MCLFVRVLAPLLLVLFGQAAWALDPAIRLQDLNHASWSEKDGVPADIQGMAQTRDGWLWLGTADGLYRFDGVRFERVPLQQNRIFNLHALDNGDLLVSYMLEGLTLLRPDGSTTELIDPARDKLGPVAAMAMDHDGAIWIAGMAGVHRYRNGKWQAMAGGADWRGQEFSLLVDQYGRVWASSPQSLYLFDRAAGKLQPFPGDALHGSLIQSPDGRIWVATGAAVRPVPAPPTGRRAPRQPDFNQAESRWAGQFDRDGNLWALKCPYGICRVANAGSLPAVPILPARQADDRFDQHWQLSALSTNVVLEDREGNIWISTQSGLDRFRENKLIPARIPGPTGTYSLASDTEGRLWAAEGANGALWQVRHDGPPVRDATRTASVIANDRDGALLIAGKRRIERIHQGRSTFIPLPPLPDGTAGDLNVFGMLDDGKVLWFASFQTGLMGLVDGKWLPRAAFRLPQRIYMSAAGDAGQLWLSHNDGKLSFYDGDRASGAPASYDIALVGAESGIFPGPQLVVGGEHGIAVLRGKTFHRLGAAHAEALNNVTGMAVTPDGDRWLNGSKGVVHVRRDDWEAAVRDPGKPLVHEVIDVLDGYPGRAAMDNRLTSVYNAGHGRLWFRATGGLVRLETATLRPNAVKPTVQLLGVGTAAASYPARGAVLLPPDSRSFNIQYTAPGLRKPEGMRFQYRLEGLDRDWQDAGTRRAAYYTNVGPGRYKFHVRAVNEDGMAGDAVATLPITVEPTVPQTWWFRTLCALAAIAVLYALYRYRLRIATGAIARQLQVRLDERERIARTLHDTFLQSLQALILRVHAVLQRLPEGSDARRKLEIILDETDLAVEEGRAQVQGLRSGHDIELVLQQAGAALAAMHPATRFQLEVGGMRRPLVPPVQEELTEIAREALRNAFRHAQAGVATIAIDYRGAEFVLTVGDDGRGLDDGEVQRRMRERHWGLVGMRERALRIGAELAIASTPGQGTAITIRAPAALAYAAAPLAGSGSVAHADQAIRP